jgi:CHAT domain-containing protein
MAVKLHSPGWSVRTGSTTRGAGGAVPMGLPPAFVPAGAETEEVIVTPPAPARGAPSTPGPLDLSVDLAPGEAAVLAVRHPSGALTFHAPRETARATRGRGGEARFIVPVRPAAPPEGAATRGLVSTVLKAVVVKVSGAVVGTLGDDAASFVLSRLAIGFETLVWKKKGLAEGWLRVTKDTLAARALKKGVPPAAERSLLLLHGTFSNAASAYSPLAASSFFEDVRPLYGDRVFAFDHFTVSRTPAENARMLLEALPKGTFTFDVITHSRGGLVLRNLVEQAASFGALGSRFTLGRAVLVAAPNEGTPLATPSRWEDTVGWVANLLELFPVDNPFVTGAEFVANALVWMAKHASGDLPGLHAMDGDGELVRALQSACGSAAADRYSVLAANYVPSGNVLARLLDVGFDQFFNGANDLVVPAEGGWRVDASGRAFIPGARIGCFGPGGNIPRGDVTHVNFFGQPETVRFLVEALTGTPHKLPILDPALRLPDRRLIRSGAPGISAPAAATGGRVGASMRARLRGAAPAPPLAVREARLRISVVNGDLTFEERPLLIGHYRSTSLTGAEKVIDRVLGGAMTDSLDRGVYPIDPGTYRIFINRRRPTGREWQPPRPQAVIVAGLGQEGQCRSAHIIHTVRQAVIAWAERVAEDGHPPRSLALASTLLASGGTGVTPGRAAQLAVQGVLEANAVLEKLPGHQPLPLVTDLRFVELYLTRATDAWEALAMAAHASPETFAVTDRIVEGSGSLRRPLASSYRGADYDYITAETQTDVNGQSLIAYALDTKRARTEVQAQATQGKLLRELIATASTDANTDDQISKTLYNLLVPLELEAFLADSGETQIEVDEGTAGIPWELITDSRGAGDERLPWAIRSKLLRKLRVEAYRTQVNDAGAEASVLVIGEPQCPADYPALPGALAEAQSVATLLASPRGVAPRCLTRLFAGGDLADGPNSRQVIDALYADSWRIVHVAGHGEPGDGKGSGGGVVLSNGTFLGANEIKAMRVVPELVFVNCCHLAAGDRRAVLGEARRGAYDRAAFASGVAQALIAIGVRSVVAAGWAVDDGAASAFATAFYDELLQGQRFIDAVAVARRKAFEFAGNTWAAYQCYGDPDWRFRPTAPAPARPREDEFAFVASRPALRRTLETLHVESTFQGKAPAVQLERLQRLERRFTALGWKATDDIGALFARAYASAGDLASAVRWYEAGVASADGSVSLGSLEQLSNLRIRLAMSAVGHAGKGAARRDAIRAARDTIAAETRTLEQLLQLGETVERASLLGSAKKRLATLERGAGGARSSGTALGEMARWYRRALEIAREQKADNLFYPAINLMAATIARGGADLKTRLPPALFAEARASVAARNAADPDFWSLAAEPELQLYEALARGTIGRQASAVVRAFTQVHTRSQGAREWGSVGDTLRFVLDPYLARTRGANAAAARRVLAAVDAFGTAAA